MTTSKTKEQSPAAPPCVCGHDAKDHSGDGIGDRTGCYMEHPTDPAQPVCVCTRYRPAPPPVADSIEPVADVCGKCGDVTTELWMDSNVRFCSQICRFGYMNNCACDKTGPCKLHGHDKPVAVDDREAYPLKAEIWKRESTQEWVLELEGGFNDTYFICRHTEPLTTAPQDVAGLPSLYALTAKPDIEVAEDSGITHELKTWPEFFEKLLSGEKTFELRRNDRDFKVGDTLRLREYIYDPGTYTGRVMDRTVTYIVEGEFGLPDDLCVMGLNAQQPQADSQLIAELVEALEQYADESNWSDDKPNVCWAWFGEGNGYDIARQALERSQSSPSNGWVAVDRENASLRWLFMLDRHGNEGIRLGCPEETGWRLVDERGASTWVPNKPGHFVAEMPLQVPTDVELPAPYTEG